MEESSAVEDDIDIYADLSIPQDKTIEQCKKCLELETEIVEYKKKVLGLQKVNRNLERNVSSLLLTAKGEVSRKDRMIADLRRQLDDASFRRGNFKRHKNYNYNHNFEYNCEPNEVTFGNDGVVFDPNRPPPSIPANFKIEVPMPPLPEDFNSNVPPPPPPPPSPPPPPPPEYCQTPPPSHNNFKTEYITPLSPDNYDEAEYICNPDPYFQEGEDEEEKFDDGINRDTVFSQRLRKRLEEEDERERKEKEEKAIFEEAERKENERLRLEETRGSCSKVNLENKENKPSFVNKPPKRSRDYEEPIAVKRPKMEPLYNPAYDDYREDWGNCGSETLQIKEEPEPSRLEYDKKSKEAEECKNLETRNILASRLYLLSEGIPRDSTSRNDSKKDAEKRKEDEKRFRDKEKYDRERCENDNYKDKFLRERYEKDKYKEKLERERHERDKFNQEWYKQERDKCEKFEREKYERKQEKDRLVRKRSRRSLSFSPERTKKFFDKKESRQTGFRDEFSIRGRGRYDRFIRKADLRQKIYRPGQEKFISDTYHRESRDIFRNDLERSRSNSCEKDKKQLWKEKGSSNSRSRSNSKDKNGREIEFRKRIFSSGRSRSNSNDKHYKNADRRITHKDYKDKKDRASLEGNSSEIARSKDIDQRMEEKKRILEMQKARLEMELSKLDERSRSSSKEKECKLSSREMDEDVVSKDRKFSDAFKNFLKKDLEEGELSDSSNSFFHSSQIHITEKKVPQMPLISEKKTEGNKSLEKTPVEKCIDKSKVEEGSNIEVDDSKKLEIPEGTVNEKCKEIDSIIKKDISLVPDLPNKSEIPSVKLDTTLCKSVEKVDSVTFSESDSDKKLASGLVIQPDDIEKHVQSLDSFIESAEQVLEENKMEANSIEKVARRAKELLQEELDKELKEVLRQASESDKNISVEPKKEDLNKNDGKKKKLTKCMKDLFSPVKERKNPKRGESKERKEENESSPTKEKKSRRRVSKGKEEGEICSPSKQKKKRNESKKRDAKEESTSVEDTESKVQVMGEGEIKKIKDLEIKTHNENVEIKEQEIQKGKDGQISSRLEEKKNQNESMERDGKDVSTPVEDAGRKVQKIGDTEIKKDLEINIQNKEDNETKEDSETKEDTETKEVTEIKEEKESFPLKEKKSKRRVSKEKGRKEVSSPLKVKKMKRNESKEKLGKEVSTPVEDTESEVQKMKSEVKEDLEIETQDRGDNEIKEEKKEGGNSSPLEEKKNEKRNDSKESDGKISTLVEDAESKVQNVGEAGIKNQIKEDLEIITQNQEDTKINEKESIPVKEKKSKRRVSKEKEEKERHRKEVSTPADDAEIKENTEIKEKESIPVKEQKNKLRVSKEKEEEISSPLEEDKNKKGKEFKERDEKGVSTPVKDIESKVENIGEAEITNQIKEDLEVKTQNQEDTKIKVKESIPVKEKKNKRRVSKEKEGQVSSPLKEKKKAETRCKKRNESKKRDGKEESTSVEGTESRVQNIEEAEIKTQNKEDIETKEEKESIPVKEKRSKRRVKEKEEISSPLKEKKKQKRNESKERDEEVGAFPVEVEESKAQKIGETEIKNEIKDLGMKTQKEGSTKQKTEETKAARPLKELNPPESKKEDSKIPSPVKDQREEIEPEVEVSSNTSGPVKERRKIIQQKEPQIKLVKVEPKKQVQKVKEVVPEKPKTKKAEEKHKKKFVVVVRKRRRPPVLSDCNASTTIVSNENVITNIKLNNSGDKNLLS